MKRSKTYFVFKAKYKVLLAPFIVEPNTDFHVILDIKKRIVKVDSVEDRAKYWEGADILVFNTCVWWMSGLRMKALWGSFGNGERGAEALDTPVAYRLELKAWANWVDSSVDPNKTKVFFTTMSPTHSRSADWGKPNGTKCFNIHPYIPMFEKIINGVVNQEARAGFRRGAPSESVEETEKT